MDIETIFAIIFLIIGVFILATLGRRGRYLAKKEISEWTDQLINLRPEKYTSEDIDLWIQDVFRKARNYYKPREIIEQNILLAKTAVLAIKESQGKPPADRDKAEKNFQEAIKSAVGRYEKTFRHF